MNGVLTCSLDEIVRALDAADDGEFFRCNFFKISDWLTKRVTIGECSDLVGPILEVAANKLMALMTVRPEMLSLLSELMAQPLSVLLVNNYPLELKKPMSELFSTVCHCASGVKMSDDEKAPSPGRDLKSTLFVLSNLPKALDLIKKNRNTIIFSDTFHLRRELVLRKILPDVV